MALYPLPVQGGSDTPMDPRGTSSGEGAGVVRVIPGSARLVAGLSLSAAIDQLGGIEEVPFCIPQLPHFFSGDNDNIELIVTVLLK